MPALTNRSLAATCRLFSQGQEADDPAVDTGMVETNMSQDDLLQLSDKSANTWLVAYTSQPFKAGQRAAHRPGIILIYQVDVVCGRMDVATGGGPGQERSEKVLSHCLSEIEIMPELKISLPQAGFFPLGHKTGLYKKRVKHRQS